MSAQDNAATADVLRRAADLIEPDGRWTRGTLARSGNPRNGPRVDGNSPSATCWCAAGAIEHECGENVGLFWTAIGFFRDYLPPPARGVGPWNDARGRTQAEVVTALRAAADLADLRAQQEPSNA